MCQDDKEDTRVLEDKKLNIELVVCKDCIEYAFDSVGYPKESIKEQSDDEGV
jgi:hypothetical protein